MKSTFYEWPLSIFVFSLERLRPHAISSDSSRTIKRPIGLQHDLLVFCPKQSLLLFTSCIRPAAFSFKYFVPDFLPSTFFKAEQSSLQNPEHPNHWYSLITVLWRCFVRGLCLQKMCRVGLNFIMTRFKFRSHFIHFFVLHWRETLPLIFYHSFFTIFIKAWRTGSHLRILCIQSVDLVHTAREKFATRGSSCPFSADRTPTCTLFQIWFHMKSTSCTLQFCQNRFLCAEIAWNTTLAISGSAMDAIVIFDSFIIFKGLNGPIFKFCCSMSGWLLTRKL